jgi:hypothetical protein
VDLEIEVEARRGPSLRQGLIFGAGISASIAIGAVVGVIAGAVFSPVALAVVGVAALGVMAYSAFKNQDEIKESVSRLASGTATDAEYFSAGMTTGDLLPLVGAAGRLARRGVTATIAAAYAIKEVGALGDDVALRAGQGFTEGALEAEARGHLKPRAIGRGVVSAEGPGGETFYRTMTRAHADELAATGRLPAATETFISPTKAYAEGYDGVLVKFDVAPGTTSRLAEVGVRDRSTATGAAFPGMPTVSKGWTAGKAFFKWEESQVNIGLGRGQALEIFNESVVSHEVLRP